VLAGLAKRLHKPQAQMVVREVAAAVTTEVQPNLVARLLQVKEIRVAHLALLHLAILAVAAAALGQVD
jgi:hypothetical protein